MKLFLLINSFIRKKKDLKTNKTTIINNIKIWVLLPVKIKAKKVTNINGILFKSPFLYRLRDKEISINPLKGLLEDTKPPSKLYEI